MFDAWLQQVKEQITQRFLNYKGRVPRASSAPFIDAKEYYEHGFTPREAAEMYLGLKRDHHCKPKSNTDLGGKQ